MKGMLNYLFIIILIGFISSCSTKRDKPIQEGNLETIRFDENQVRELPFSFFCGHHRINSVGDNRGESDRGNYASHF